MPEVSRFYGIITIQEGIITGSLPRRALNLVYDWLDPLTAARPVQQDYKRI